MPPQVLRVVRLVAKLVAAAVAPESRLVLVNQHVVVQRHLPRERLVTDFARKLFDA